MYPLTRLRRNRKAGWLRDLVADTNISMSNLILPIFIVEGIGKREEVATLPGICRLSIDEVVNTTKIAAQKGIKAVALFPAIEYKLKTEDGREAYNKDNLVCRTIKAIKDAGVDIGVICDVALDPYTSHGHDGMVDAKGNIDNDKSVAALCKQALTLAEAGADIIAPSDMMDGRIKAIRTQLGDNSYSEVGILAYAAKYNSCLYSPFRDALNNKKRSLDKSTYQMDIRNHKEALREIEQDILEGADMVMVKPGMMYLDIIATASKAFNVPIFAFQVTGEYAMLKHAASLGGLDFDRALLESLIAFRRAGATSILTYAALEAADLIN